MSALTRVNRRANAQPLPWRIIRQLGRFLVIILAGVLVVVGTAALVQSPLGAPIVAAMSPGGGGNRAAAARAPAGAERPRPAEGVSAGGERGRSAEGGSERPRSAEGGQGSRNVPAIQRGLPVVLRYAAIMAGLTLVVVLVLRARRPRARQQAAQVMSAGRAP